MQDDFDPLLLRNQLCFPIYLCSKEIIRRYTPLLKKLNLTYTQYIVMMYFWENNQCNEKELSKALLIDPSTLTPLLRKLEAKNYLQRTRSSTDKRNLTISITEKGQGLKREALSIPKAIGECINLTKEEAEIFYRLLYKTLANIERSINK